MENFLLLLGLFFVDMSIALVLRFVIEKIKERRTLKRLSKDIAEEILKPQAKGEQGEEQ